jgi:NodT family efflux transporter outer membrane factor (OMF) lipoprotein
MSMPRFKGRRAALAICTALLAGCTVGPDYVRPPVEVPAHFKEQVDWKRAEPADVIDRGRWWSIFADPELDALAARVVISNQNVRIAEANYRQARAVASQARAAYYPTVGGTAAGRRSQSSSVSSTRPAFASGITNSREVSLDASWEIDLWGRIRRSVEGAEANAQASEADLAAATLAAQSELAQNYLLLRITEIQQQLLADTVTAFTTTLKLTQNRYAAGVAARVDVVQAETQVKSTQAEAIDLQLTRAQLEHAIALLVGEPPSSFSIPRAPFKARMPSIPVGVPSELLQRRPDIAAAERRVASANAQIGVAEAAFYPSLSITAAGGYAAPSTADLFSLPARFWSVGPALAQLLFDGGARKAVTEQARAAYDAQVAAYRQTVLIAFAEVEDNLAALRILEAEAAVQQEAVESARKSVELTTNQYQAGIVSFINVAAVQASALNNERAAVTLLGRRLSASVALVRATGGGWIVEAPDQAAR